MEVSTVNSTTSNTDSGQLIGDDSLQHEQKSQFLMNTKINNKTISQANINMNNSNNNNSKNNTASLNYNNNHNSPPPTPTIKLAKNEVGETISENVTSIDNDLDNDIRDTIKDLIEGVISGLRPINNVSVQGEQKHSAKTATPATHETQEPTLNNAPDKEVVVSKEVDMDELGEYKPKDMVTLRNLEITPPPPPSEENIVNNEDKGNGEKNTGESLKRRASKRRRATTSESTTDLNESSESTSRSKRQRTQTKLFQVGDATDERSTPVPVISSVKNRSSKPNSRGRKKSTASSTSDANHSAAQDTIIRSTNDLPDVICYEKNDYLAIRNEEGTFYLCQLAENVRARRQFIKVRWLDTDNGGKTYFLTSQFDKVPQKSIIMPVNLDKSKSEKKGGHIFILDDLAKDNVLERLKRSLNATSDANSSQELSTDD